MRLEQQLEALAELGLRLNPGITIDDLLYSFDRELYEQKPFDLLLSRMGGEVEREPWERWICAKVWYFDTECIYATGDYSPLVKRLCDMSGDSNYLSDVQDNLDFDSGSGWLSYKVNGQTRQWTVDIQDDWADTLVLSYVMDDLERDGNHFYKVDDSQCMLLFYLDGVTAARVGELLSKELEPMLPGG